MTIHDCIRTKLETQYMFCFEIHVLCYKSPVCTQLKVYCVTSLQCVPSLRHLQNISQLRVVHENRFYHGWPSLYGKKMKTRLGVKKEVVVMRSW